MKKLVLFSILFLASLPTLAQEKYFHELKGMEDSTGTTHLFYRLYEKTSFQCSEGNGGHIVTSTYDNVYHLDTSENTDSLKFADYYSPWCLDGYYTTSSVETYTFLDNDPAKYLYTSNGDYCSGSLISYSDNYFEFYIPCLIKQSLNHPTVNWSNRGLIQNLQNSAVMVYFGWVDSHIQLSTNPNEWPVFEWEDYDGFEGNSGAYFEFIDSVSIGLDLIAIHPTIDSIYYAKSISDSIKSSKFETIFPELNVKILRFDSEPSLVYSIHFDGSNKLAKSDNYGRTGSWLNLNLPIEFGKLQFLEVDASRSGFLFIADSTSIFMSKDFGESFELHSEMKYRITGLYKKPDSDILYVLSTDELFEVNTETNSITSLKKLPVSNEEPKEIPNSITLHQNYPNPFNPRTTISFELDKSVEVTLTVFDALGRTVAVLVNEQKSIGLHQVGFDASNLSSGIYFYRLRAGEFVGSKRFTLIK
ncbi:MAG: T9SS type A sorting domain-containing protein [Balneolaceae bacterium]